MADETMTWTELAERDPELCAVMLRVDCLSESLRSKVLVWIRDTLDLLVVAVLQTRGAE
jgi:hypothetical protein